MDEMRNIENAIDYLKSKKPEELAKFAKHVSREYPETIQHLMAHVAKGDHITNHHEYYECVDSLKWMDHSGHGEKFKLDDVVRMAEKLAKIDFDEEEYTEYDFAYMVNLLYAIWCKDFKEVTTFLKLAKRVFDYSKMGQQQHYGAFFKPISKHHSQMEYRSEYRSEYENRRGVPNSEYRNEEDRMYEQNSYRNQIDNRQYNDSEYRRSR